MKTRYFYFDHGKYGRGEQELPPPDEHQLLVRTVRSLVSVGTETAANTGLLSWKEGWHGYSNVGRVEKVGSAVSGWKPGDRVFSQQAHVDAYVCRPGECDMHRIPDEVDDESATYTTLGVVALHLIERANIVIGRPVIVMGLGTVGQLAWQLAKAAGAGMVIGVEIDAKKREKAVAMGLEAAIAPEEKDLQAFLAKLPKYSPPPVFVDVTGAARAVEWCVNVAPLQSRIVLGGGYTAPVTLSSSKINSNELEVVGGHQPKCPQEPIPYYPFCREFNHRYVLQLLADGRLKTRTLADARITPDELMSFYDAGRDKKPRPNQPIIHWENKP